MSKKYSLKDVVARQEIINSKLDCIAETQVYDNDELEDTYVKLIKKWGAIGR